MYRRAAPKFKTHGPAAPQFETVFAHFSSSTNRVAQALNSDCEFRPSLSSHYTPQPVMPLASYAASFHWMDRWIVCCGGDDLGLGWIAAPFLYLGIPCKGL